MSTSTPKPNSNSKSKPTYISSSGAVLETPPLQARLTRTFDDIYNFLGLYLVSLFSLDPYTAAQNSQFNTRSRPNAYQDRPRWGFGGNNNTTGNRSGSNNNTPGGRGGGGGGSGGPGTGGRPIGRVDDVRAPECGSCG